MTAMGEVGAFVKAILQDAMSWTSSGGGGDVPVELGDALIALMLMKERSYEDLSDLKPYLDMLPETLGMPLFWPGDERERLLGGCMILQDTLALSQAIDSQVDSFISRMKFEAPSLQGS